jgi:chromosome partitioning protein
MKTVAFFNNKGGVGKTSLVYHLAWMFADLGKRVIVADLDPQSNLTSALLPENRLEALWNGDGKTIYGAIKPLADGTGDINQPHVEEIDERLGLIPGDLSLSRFEDELSQQWPSCLIGKERAFRVETCFSRLIAYAADTIDADIAFIDVGPNLGAINRSALIASDHVIVPLAPDLYSLQGMRNLGPSLRSWRAEWHKCLQAAPPLGFALPKGEMEPSGYVLMRHSIRLDRPVKAYERWIDKMPSEYRSSVLDKEVKRIPQAEDDPYCLGMMKDYRSLMPMALEANKPIFHLTAADGAMGAHYQYVQDAKKDFKELAMKIAGKVGEGFSP